MHYDLGQLTHWMHRVEATVKRKQRISFSTRIGIDTGMMGFNLLAPELFILILAHSVYKM